VVGELRAGRLLSIDPSRADAAFKTRHILHGMGQFEEAIASKLSGLVKASREGRAREGRYQLFPLGQPDRHVRRGADDPRTSVGVALALDQRFQVQKEFLGEHEKKLPLKAAASGMEVRRSPAHLAQAGLYGVAINQVEQRPHDRLHC
jgi:hypothetical protein